MNNLRQVSLGILAALVSVALLFGSLMMAFVEGGARMALPVTETPIPPSTVTPSMTPMPGTPSAVPVTATDTPLPTETPTVTPTPYCTPPEGWSAIIVQPGDTLESLAQTYGTTVKKLMSANCLLTGDLIPGTLLYVPNIAPTATEYDCGPPYGWVFYTVKSGDTLYSIAQAYGTTVAALQRANCMGSSTTIRVGQQLYVPYKVTSTPWTSPTPTMIPTQSGTPEYPPTLTPVPTPTYTNPEYPTPGPITPTFFPTIPATPLPTLDPDPASVAPIPY